MAAGPGKAGRLDPRTGEISFRSEDPRAADLTIRGVSYLAVNWAFRSIAWAKRRCGRKQSGFTMHAGPGDLIAVLLNIRISASSSHVSIPPSCPLSCPFSFPNCHSLPRTNLASFRRTQWGRRCSGRQRQQQARTAAKRRTGEATKQRGEGSQHKVPPSDCLSLWLQQGCRCLLCAATSSCSDAGFAECEDLSALSPCVENWLHPGKHDGLLSRLVVVSLPLYPIVVVSEFPSDIWLTHYIYGNAKEGFHYCCCLGATLYAARGWTCCR